MGQLFEIDVEGCVVTSELLQSFLALYAREQTGQDHKVTVRGVATDKIILPGDTLAPSKSPASGSDTTGSATPHKSPRKSGKRHGTK